MLVSELKSCYAQLLGDFKNIYGLNGYKLPTNKDSYHKYQPLRYIEDDIKNGEITFVFPNVWEDPYEKRFYKKNYQNINFCAPEICCLCLTTKQAQNEDAMWKVYSQPNEYIVRAQIKIADLLSALDGIASKNHFKVYIGEAIYAEKKYINGITLATQPYFPTNNFSIENYLTLMLLKRISYQYENEVRVFIVFENKQAGNNLNEKTYKVPIGTNTPIISSILLPPYKILTLTDKVLSEGECSRKKLIEKELKVKVKQSRLYSACKKFII